MNRGEIWLIDLAPTVGAEISKRRPALIINENGMGKLPLKIIAPITAWKSHYNLVPWMVHAPGDDSTGLDKESSIDCFQARSVSQQRMISRIGSIQPHQMEQVEAGLRAVLGL